jgi:hypothetical protein
MKSNIANTLVSATPNNDEAASSSGAQFIFHAVGNWNKGQVLYDVITNQRDVIWPNYGSHLSSCTCTYCSYVAAVFSQLEAFRSVAHDFRLIRGVGLDLKKKKQEV